MNQKLNICSIFLFFFLKSRKDSYEYLFLSSDDPVRICEVKGRAFKVLVDDATELVVPRVHGRGMDHRDEIFERLLGGCRHVLLAEYAWNIYYSLLQANEREKIVPWVYCFRCCRFCYDVFIKMIIFDGAFFNQFNINFFNMYMKKCMFLYIIGNP